MLPINLQINEAHTKMGEGVFVVGNIPLLGMWNAENAVKLYTSKELYPSWRKTIKADSKTVGPGQSRTTGFSDNMIQLGFETPASQQQDSSTPSGEEESRPLYLDLDGLRGSLGDDFVIEYKYFVKNKLNHIFWEHGKTNRQIHARDLLQKYQEINQSSTKGGWQSLLVIEDQKYNNLLLTSRMYVERCDVPDPGTTRPYEQIDYQPDPKELIRSSKRGAPYKPGYLQKRNASSSSRNHSTDSCSDVKTNELMHQYQTNGLSSSLKLFQDQIVQKDKLLVTRAQKIQMIRGLIMNQRPGERVLDFASDTNDSQINSSLNSANQQQGFAIDGLAMVCAYLYHGIGTLNSNLSTVPNQRQNLQNAFDLFRHIDDNLLVCNASLEAKFMCNSHLARQLKHLMSTSAFLGLQCTQSSEEILEQIKNGHGGQISIDLARYQTHFAPKPAMTLLLDLDQAYSLRQSLNILAQQSLNGALRIDNERDKELFLLASLAEIEVTMTLGQKIREIVDVTLHGKLSPSNVESAKFGSETPSTGKASPRKKSNGGSQKRKTSTKTRSRLEATKQSSDSQKPLGGLQIRNKNAKAGTPVGAVLGPNLNSEEERLKIMMAMTLLILKNIQYDDQGEEKSPAGRLTEVDCILRQLKSIMKQQQVQKGVKTPRRATPALSHSAQMQPELLLKLLSTTGRIKKFASDLIASVIKPFCNASRQLAQALRVDKNQIKLFKENICEKHMVFALIKSVDFIHDTVCSQLQTLGVYFQEEPSMERQDAAYMNYDKGKPTASTESPENVYQFTFSPVSEQPVKPDAARLQVIDQEFNKFISQVYKQDRDIMQVLFDVNMERGQMSPANDTANIDLSPLVLGQKAWNHYQLKNVQQMSPFEFSLAPSVIIPMTIPVKFAIAEGKRYHQIRNMFKELDQMTESNQGQENLRARTVDDLMQLFDQNAQSIEQVVMYIISNLSIFEETSLQIIQSPTFEIEKHITPFNTNKELSIKDNIATQLKTVWLNLLSQEAVRLRQRLKSEAQDPDIKIKTYLSQMSLIVQQNLKFDERQETFNFVAWGFKNGKIIIHIALGSDNLLDESADSRSTAFRLEYDRQTFKSVLQRYSTKTQLKSRDGSKRRLDHTKQHFWTNTALLTDLGDRIGKLCAFLDQNLRSNDCSYKKAMAAIMQKNIKSNRNMHEIEEESDDYSNEDAGYAENANQIQSSSRVHLNSPKLTPVFKLKGIVLVKPSKLQDQEMPKDKNQHGGYQIQYVNKNAGGTKKTKVKSKSPTRANGGQVHKIALNPNGGFADSSGQGSASSYDLFLSEFIW